MTCSPLRIAASTFRRITACDRVDAYPRKCTAASRARIERSLRLNECAHVAEDHYFIHRGESAPPNFSSQLVAGLLPRAGLKPRFPPETHGVMPLADAARRLRR
jgi:hypothetical protein